MKASQNLPKKSQSFPEQKSKPMREVMPMTAAFIDDLRAAFGGDLIDAQIRRGMKGEAVFYAEEGGTSIGTRPACDSVSIYRNAAGQSVSGPVR